MTVTLTYTVKEVARICEGKWLLRNDKSVSAKYILLDSRKSGNAPDALFFALTSAQQDSRQYVYLLYKKGTRNFIVDRDDIDIQALAGSNVILVPNAILALQKLAQHHRMRYQLPVIGITGSNGKTIVKEWIYQILTPRYSIVRSPKSYNSQVGVPLSVLQINDKHDLGIFEAGISLPGEMQKLEKMIRPQIGLLTNIGSAHDEGFSGKPEKIREKLKLFINADHLIFGPADDILEVEIARFATQYPNVKLFRIGKDRECTMQIKNIETGNGYTSITTAFRDKDYLIQIPFVDAASAENAIHSLAVVFASGSFKEDILLSFRGLQPVAMRLELKEGINHCTLINDSYSNDIQSLKIALDFLQQQKQEKKRAVILSDILQSSQKPAELYKGVAALLGHYEIFDFVGIGPDIARNRHQFDFIKNSRFYPDTESFLGSGLLYHFHEQIILVKGARSFGFERITHKLEQKIHQTVLAIHLGHLAYNLKQYRQNLPAKTKIMAMVKAFGYGSGSHQIASVLEYNKADYLAVAYADEGVELRKAGISLPVMVMNTDASVFEAIVDNMLEPELFSIPLLAAFLEFLENRKATHYPIHLKLDTGMHRLGFDEKDMQRVGDLLRKNPYVRVASAFSHLASSDDPLQDQFTLLQYERFNRYCAEIEKQLGYPFLKHISNTAASIRLPQMQMDMVRIGIGLYGLDANPAMQKKLKNVSTLTTTISQIKQLPAGETVGYGRRGQVEKDSTIATVRLGYADGYPRNLGNGGGRMFVRDRLAPVIGNVCMDMTMLDITGIDDIREGDEVLVFGKELPLPLLAEWAHTIPYEIMTGIGQRVKRVYFEE